MLRLVPRCEAPTVVPWTIDRSDRRHPVVRFDGYPAADAVRVFRRHVTVEHWGRMHPGESAAVCLCNSGGRSDELIALAWFDPLTDIERVWAFAA